MATTDSNGIVFLEETDPISPFHTTINTLQQGTSDAIGSFSSGSGGSFIIHYVANTAARSALAAAYGPTASKPLYVYRGDATVGLELEVTEDGTTWRAYPVSTPWTTATLASGWESVSGYPAQWRVIDGWCELRGIVQKTSANIATAALEPFITGGAPATVGATLTHRLVIALTDGSANGLGVATLNPRSDGAIRIQAHAANGRFVCLDGARYRVA